MLGARVIDKLSVLGHGLCAVLFYTLAGFAFIGKKNRD